MGGVSNHASVVRDVEAYPRGCALLFFCLELPFVQPGHENFWLFVLVVLVVLVLTRSAHFCVDAGDGALADVVVAENSAALATVVAATREGEVAKTVLAALGFLVINPLAGVEALPKVVFLFLLGFLLLGHIEWLVCKRIVLLCLRGASERSRTFTLFLVDSIFNLLLLGYLTNICEP